METEIERLRKKAENFPSASLYTRLAELARQGGDDAEAESVCRRCIREFPRSGQAYVMLAEIKIAQQKKSEALHLLQQGLEKDPRSYAAHRLMADLAESKEQAIKHLTQILTFKPGDPTTIQRVIELGGRVPTGTTTAKHRAVRQVAPGVLAAPGVSAAPAPQIKPRPVGAIDLSDPLPFPPMSPRPASPSNSPGAATTLLRQLSTGKAAALDALCSEAGVRGAAIVDAQGRVVTSKNLADGQDELLAALAADIMKTAISTLAAVGGTAPNTWVLGATLGQVLTFTRDRSVSVVVLADPGVRPAMLELRARQALIDLGAG